jgi:hypothetical protein
MSERYNRQLPEGEEEILQKETKPEGEGEVGGQRSEVGKEEKMAPKKKAKSEKVLDVAEQMCMIMRGPGHYVIWFGHMILINGRMVEGLSRKKLDAMVMRIMNHLKVETTVTGLYANFNRVLVAIRKVVNQNWDGVAVTLSDGFDAVMKDYAETRQVDGLWWQVVWSSTRPRTGR